MKKAFPSIFIIYILLGSCQQQSKPDGWALLGGDTFLPQMQQGKYIFINYWAQWCKPCLKEMPELAAFANNNIDKVTVLAVNFDGVNAQEMQRQARQFDIQIPMLLGDPATTYAWPKAGVLPFTIVIDSQLNIIDNLIGPQTLESLNTWLRTQ